MCSTALCGLGARCLIAVPNVLYYKNRLCFLAGHFEYEETGIMDHTHLHFFTWHTADRYLVDTVKELKLVYKVAEGSAPLWVLRRWVLPVIASTKIDAFLVRLFPNLFGWQIVMSAKRFADITICQPNKLGNSRTRNASIFVLAMTGSTHLRSTHSGALPSATLYTSFDSLTVSTR